MGILNIGVSGINAAQAKLVTTSHNIANVGTSGYSRQATLQSSNYPSSGAGGYYGSGATINSVVRYYNAHLETQLRDAYSRTGDIAAYYGELLEIDNLLASTDAGLTSILNNFFSAMDAVAENPQDISIRQQFITVSNTLAARVQAIDARLDEINAGINSEVVATVEQINIHAENIANLNKQIQMARVSGKEPNDLLDQRDYQLTELSKLINVDMYENQTGGYNVFIGNGQALVMGEEVSKLGTRLSTLTSDVEIVTYDIRVGEVELSQDILTGGQLGGLLAARTGGVDVAKNYLGSIVVGLVQTFNAQHLLGTDLEGYDGKLFFNALEPQVNPNTLNKGDATVTATFATPSELLEPDYRLERTVNGYQLFDSNNTLLESFGTLPHEYGGFVIQITGQLNTGDAFTLSSTGIVPDSTNTGSGGITVNVSNVQASDYLLTKTVTGYTLLRQSDNTYIPVPSTFPGESFVVDGMVISLNGDATKNDTFLIRPTHDIADMFKVNVQDPKEIAASFGFRTEAATTNTGSATISEGVVSALPPLSDNAPNIRETVTLTFNDPPTSFTVTGEGTGGPITLPYQSGSPISFNGWTVEISGTAKAGDQFVVSENQAGVADNRNAMTLFNMQSQNLIAGGTNSYNGVYRTLVSDIGMKTNLAESTGLAEYAILEQKVNDRESLSGVSLEEEAGNLIRYQQAYQAASKVIQMASTLFDNILQAVR